MTSVIAILLPTRPVKQIWILVQWYQLLDGDVHVMIPSIVAETNVRRKRPRTPTCQMHPKLTERQGVLSVILKTWTLCSMLMQICTTALSDLASRLSQMWWFGRLATFDRSIKRLRNDLPSLGKFLSCGPLIDRTCTSLPC